MRGTCEGKELCDVQMAKRHLAPMPKMKMSALMCRCRMDVGEAGHVFLAQQNDHMLKYTCHDGNHVMNAKQHYVFVFPFFHACSEQRYMDAMRVHVTKLPN